MADLKKLLNKKGWTGRELGIIELANMAITFGQTLRHEEVKPIIEDSQLRKMVNEIQSPAQGKIYNGYISIHNWLNLKYNMAQTQLQYAQLQYRTLEGYVTQAIIAEDTYTYIEKLPAIMTQEQYEELKAERIEAYFKGEDGEELASNVFNLIERAIHYYLERLAADPKKANPLKAIQKKYGSQPVKSKLILDRYNEATDNGYYTIEDGSGRRSDQMSNEEWQKAITTPKMEEALTQMRTTDGRTTEFTRFLAEERLKARAKVIFDGGTEEEADRIQEEEDYKNGLAVPVKWHLQEEPPQDLSKWDIIEDELLLEFYPADIDGSGDEYSRKNFTASMKDFVKEFPELVAVILSDIDKRYSKKTGLQLSELPVEKWETTTISWRDLYSMDFYGEREEAESDTNIFYGNKRALFNGIAIVRPSDLEYRSRSISKEGKYIEPEIPNSYKFNSLEAFFTEAEEYAVNVEIVESSQKDLLDSYYFLKAYNYVLDRIAEIHDVPEIDVFKMDLEAIEERIDALNDLVPMLYRRIKDTDYTDKELQQRKLQVLRDHFQPIKYDELELPEEAKEEAERIITDFTAFSPQMAEHFVYLLFVRDSGEGV